MEIKTNVEVWRGSIPEILQKIKDVCFESAEVEKQLIQIKHNREISNEKCAIGNIYYLLPVVKDKMINEETGKTEFVNIDIDIDMELRNQIVIIDDKLETEKI